MKLLTSLLFSFLAATSFAQLNPEVLQLMEDKDYFQLEEKLKDSKLDKKTRDYAQALVYNAFGQYDKSIAIINNWASNYSTDGMDSVYQDLLNANVDNFYKTSRFKEAAATTKMLMDNFPEITTTEQRTDLANTYQIWNGLGDTKGQEITLDKTTELSFTRDVANLVNIKVDHAGGTTVSVFDTGANISVASESTAKSMQLKIVAENIAVKAITGNEVMAQIGVADQLKIGDITIKNAYFLIFKDADLTFGSVYKIDLIVGFPIIMGMGEIAVDQVANTMTIVKNPAPRKVKNLYVDGLTPIIQVKMDKKPLLLSFDSGADKTMFYQRFYKLVKDDKNYELTPGKSTIGGAGGSKTIDIMVSKHLELEVGGQKVALEKNDVLPDNMMDKKDSLYGNLGQDVLKSRRKYILNLKDMYFELHD